MDSINMSSGIIVSENIPTIWLAGVYLQYR